MPTDYTAQVARMKAAIQSVAHETFEAILREPDARESIEAEFSERLALLWLETTITLSWKLRDTHNAQKA